MSGAQKPQNVPYSLFWYAFALALGFVAGFVQAWFLYEVLG